MLYAYMSVHCMLQQLKLSNDCHVVYSVLMMITCSECNSFKSTCFVVDIQVHISNMKVAHKLSMSLTIY